MNTEEKSIPALRKDLQFTVHDQNKSLWYSINDQRSGRFVRLGTKEYLVASLFDGQRTASDVLKLMQQEHPKLDASEGDIAKLTAWLVRAGLLDTPNSAPAQKPSHEKIVLNPLLIRIPLIRGCHIEGVAAKFTYLLNRWSFVCFVLLCLTAGICVLGNWNIFSRSAAGLFVSDGRMWWIVAWLVLKTVHELGHAVTAVKAGSQIRAAGISFIFFAPVPYIDITDLWTVPSRWQRILCSVGGMLAELSVASAAAIVAVMVSHESVQYFCCALATLGTITTLAFNANPLVRFDGYFIASDLLNRSNLWTDGQKSVKQFLACLIHPFRGSWRQLRLGLFVYGLACYQYRVAMYLALAFWAVLVWEGLGVIVVAWCGFAMLAQPWIKQWYAAKQAAKMGSTSDATAQRSYAQLAWNTCLACFLLAGIFWLPSPIPNFVPAVVDFYEPHMQRAETEGFIQDVFVTTGQYVHAGDVLAVLVNPELQQQVLLQEKEIEIVRAMILAMQSRGELAALQAEEAKLESLRTQLQQLRVKAENLTVRAKGTGILVQSQLEQSVGKFVGAGDPLGLIADTGSLEIRAVAAPDDAALLRQQLDLPVAIRLADGAAARGVVRKVAQRGSEVLHDPQLAAIYDGPVSVEMVSATNGQDELRVLSPRFEVHVTLAEGVHDAPRANLGGRHKAASLVPGQLAWVQVDGRSSTIWTSLYRWIQLKWHEAEQQV